jgi:hypothetical protein
MSYIPGDFWRICDRCATKVRASATAEEWTGLIVCRSTCFEHRHPQDFVRGVADRQAVTNPRPEHTEPMRIDVEHIRIDDDFIRVDQRGDSFIDTNEITRDDL